MSILMYFQILYKGISISASYSILNLTEFSNDAHPRYLKNLELYKLNIVLHTYKREDERFKKWGE
jgi:hypothetical protein